MKHDASLSHRVLAPALVIALLAGSAVYEMAQQGRPTVPPPQPPTVTTPSDVWEEQQHKQMEKKANLQRQADIRKDTEKLLELATELKQYVDKSNENTLSLDVVKKAEQIEKLAKQVKEKMKGP
jgi:oligoribonuclease NrnB/cAMP/cGMP phosphodiesterase (DHH superfamily)